MVLFIAIKPKEKENSALTNAACFSMAHPTSVSDLNKRLECRFRHIRVISRFRSFVIAGVGNYRYGFRLAFSSVTFTSSLVETGCGSNLE
jgi:hypothetical protein